MIINDKYKLRTITIKKKYLKSLKKIQVYIHLNKAMKIYLEEESLKVL